MATAVSKKKKVMKEKKVQKYSTDHLASQLWLKLHEDFVQTEGREFAAKAKESFMKGIDAFRVYEFPELGHISPHRFRAWKQLECLLKKYTFTHDAISPEERTERSVTKFFDTQCRISTGIRRTEMVHRVVQRARKIARRILGPFNLEDCIEQMRFGTKSSLGCTLDNAYLDYKLTTPEAFTGSSEVASILFREVIEKSPLFSSIVQRFHLETEVTSSCDYLKLVCVPKKWDVDRTITPLSLLDLYYSFGLGGVVTDRLLRNASLSIRKLQRTHKDMIRRFSNPNDRVNFLTHVTADLSSASDSITSELLNMVLPRDWYNALKPLFKRKLVHGGIQYYTASVLPMGNGATFPLETLVFYILTKAIGELAGRPGIYSVYGDDLIYPSKIHKYVAAIFPQLKLVLNLDKTFVSFPFRESCGEDYYRNVPVRPFYLQGSGELLTKRKYQAFLYKVINSLHRRWWPEECPLTTAFLLQEVGRLDPVHRVPPSYPDSSGIKVDSVTNNFIPWYIPTSPVSIIWLGGDPRKRVQERGSKFFQFKYLREVAKDRYIVDQAPYYLLALLGGDIWRPEHDLIPFWETDFSLIKKRTGLGREVYRDGGLVGRDKPLLEFRNVKKKVTYRRPDGRVVNDVRVKSKAVVPQRNSGITRQESGQASDWI